MGRTKAWLTAYIEALHGVLERESDGPAASTVKGLRHEARNLEGYTRRCCGDAAVATARHNADVLAKLYGGAQ